MATDLSLKAFTRKQSNKGYKLSRFIENGIELTVLVERGKDLSSCSYYAFGCMDCEQKLWWFFNGKALVKNRTEALKIYNLLKNHCKNNDLGIPFAFKVKKNRNKKKEPDLTDSLSTTQIS